MRKSVNEVPLHIISSAIFEHVTSQSGLGRKVGFWEERRENDCLHDKIKDELPIDVSEIKKYKHHCKIHNIFIFY